MVQWAACLVSPPTPPLLPAHSAVISDLPKPTKSNLLKKLNPLWIIKDAKTCGKVVSEKKNLRNATNSLAFPLCTVLHHVHFLMLHAFGVNKWNANAMTHVHVEIVLKQKWDWSERARINLATVSAPLGTTVYKCVARAWSQKYLSEFRASIWTEIASISALSLQYWVTVVLAAGVMRLHKGS